MRTITYVTGNAGKVDSLQAVLAGTDIKIVQKNLDLPEMQLESVVNVSQQKALAAFARIKTELVVQDSGFYVNAYPGWPGPYTKHTISTLGLSGMLALMANELNRSCYFLECLTYCDGVDLVTFERRVSGHMTCEPLGEAHARAHSILHQIFIPQGERLTIAQMSNEMRDVWRKKNPEQHYGRQFARWISERSA